MVPKGWFEELRISPPLGIKGNILHISVILPLSHYLCDSPSLVEE